jgi:1-acyl-sn-glycerol-3-phosphate acyltransferase
MKNLRAAVKLLLFTALTLGIYSFWWLLSFVVPNKIYWRQTAFGWWAKSFVIVSGMKIETIGKPPRPPFFLVTNHLSYVDIAALRCVVTGVFVAKAEVNTWPVAGRICRDMGTIFINRSNRRDIPRAGVEIIQRLEAGEGVVVFPEGTSTKGDKVHPFNSSFLEFAAKAEVPVSYAAITYRTPDGEMAASSAVCWWEDIGFFAHMYRLFKVPTFTAILNFGDEPIVGHDRKALAADLRRHVADRFIPVL